MEGRIIELALDEDRVDVREAEAGSTLSSLYDVVADDAFALAFPSSGGMSAVVAIYQDRRDGRICRDVAHPGLARAMASLGYVAIIAHGCAHKLSYLKVTAESVEVQHCENIRFCPPEHFANVLCTSPSDGWLAIGEAGERQSPLAGSVTDGLLSIGRGGLAATMGSMNLKGIICTGVAEAPGPSILGRRQLRGALMKDLNVHGSASIVDIGMEKGWFAHSYYAPYFDPRCRGLDGRSQCRDFAVEHSACPGCPVACRTADQDSTSPLPDWQEAMALGSNLGIFSTMKVARLLSQCLHLGLDPVETGEVLSYLNNQECVPYTLPAVRGASISELERCLSSIAARKGNGELVSAGLAALLDAVSMNGRAPVYDFRGAHAQALFSMMGELTPCHVDLVLGLKDLADSVTVGRIAAWLRIYTHALENRGLPAFYMVPMLFLRLSKWLFKNLVLMRCLLKSFKLDGSKARSLAREGLESVDAFSSQFGPMLELPSLFLYPGRPGYTDEVNVVKLTEGYEDELAYIRHWVEKGR